MAAITTAKRKTILLKVRALVDELIRLNDGAAHQATAMTGLGSGDPEDTIDLMFTGAGLATGTNHDGVAEDTISDEVVGILYGNITVLVDSIATALSWTHE